MSLQWMTVAEAAARLKVHPRTIERRIVNGKLDSRRTDANQVQVALEADDEPLPAADAIEAVKDFADRHIDLAAGSASAIVRLTQQAADRAIEDLLIVRSTLASAQRQTKAAWIAVGIAASIFPAAVMVVANIEGRSVTEARSLAQARADQLDARGREALQLQSERDIARADRDMANIAKAHAEGELAAYKVEVAENTRLMEADRKAATQPSNLLNRLLAAFNRPAAAQAIQQAHD